MRPIPLVSVVVAPTDDPARIGDSLRSCMTQSMSQIEVICIEDGRSQLIDDAAKADSRIRVVRGRHIPTASDARRVGVELASAPYVLFLDPGDELHRDALSTVHQMADDANADIVELGAISAEPREASNVVLLHGEAIIGGLFSDGAFPGRGVERYAFRTELLRSSYAALPATALTTQQYDRAATFLALSSASTFVSLTSAPPYLRRATVEPALATDRDVRLKIAASVVASLAAINPIVRDRARNSPNPEPLLEAYETARLAAVGDALKLLDGVSADDREETLGALFDTVGELDLIASAATLMPSAFAMIASISRHDGFVRGEVSGVLIATSAARGGSLDLAVEQAEVLRDAGFRVAIATQHAAPEQREVTDGAALVQIAASTPRHRIAQWANLLRDLEIDMVIDHGIVSDHEWLPRALAARACRATTVGWTTTSIDDPTFLASDIQSIPHLASDVLAHLVVPSDIDVAFWKLRGVNRVAHAPTSPPRHEWKLASQALAQRRVDDRKLELVSWGPWDDRTDVLVRLLDVAAELKRQSIQFRLRIFANHPPGAHAQWSSAVARRGLAKYVDLIRCSPGEGLSEVVDTADIFVNTAVADTSLATITEAQAGGLPVVSYGSSDLARAQAIPGALIVRAGDAASLASIIIELAADHVRLEALSLASIDEAKLARTQDLSLPYRQLLTGAPPSSLSPEPTIRDGQRVLEILLFADTQRSPSRAPTSPSRKAIKRRRGTSSRGTAPRHSKLSLTARTERRLTPAAHRVLSVAPWLRPIARHVKHLLLRF